MMKKILALLFCLLLAFALTGCSKSDPAIMDEPEVTAEPGINGMVVVEHRIG